MTTRTYSPSHPILFVFDFSNVDMKVPHYDPQEVASANEGCVSIRTIADVDGDVTVTLVHRLPEEVAQAGVEVFRGTIDAPGKSVALVTSDNEKLLEIDVADTKPTIRVLVDEKAYPTRIWVEAR